jgi:carbamoyl-phosphate synthase large subunit
MSESQTRNRARRVLVTAVGGDLGQAIVKALRVGTNPAECHGCDADPEGIGQAFVDSFHHLPRTEDREYVPALTGLVRRLGVEAVIPGSDAEIAVLSALSDPPQVGRTPVICQPAAWLKVYGDKLRCMEALRGRVPLADFADGQDRAAVSALAARAGFPLVVKPRASRGRRNLHVVQSDALLWHAIDITPSPVVQRFITDDEGEFSVGVFVCDAFTSAIAFRRDLGPAGCSWYAETSDDPAVLRYALDVAAASGLRGSGNVQVRRTADGVFLLEVNARFSSLVALRALCGFPDVDWSITARCGGAPVPPRFRAVRFRRFFHEMVDDGAGFAPVQAWAPRGSGGGHSK